MKLPLFGSVVARLGVGALVIFSGFGPAGAAEPKSYVISPNDGYGLQDCLATPSDCGQVVADAFCEAHGQSVALSLGPRSKFTDEATRISTSEEPYVINCAD